MKKIIKPKKAHLGYRLSPAEEIQLVQSGAPVSLAREIQREAALTQEALAQILGVSRRTLISYMQKRHFDVEASDRVVQMKRILELAEEAFDNDRTAAISWLKSPNRALGNRTPLELLSTATGVRAVEQVIGRMEHSLYS